MDIEVYVRNVDDAARLRALAQEKLDAALQRYTSRVRRAIVRLEDETGPHQHKVDKVCSIELQLNGSDVRIREVGTDFGAVINVAVDRMRAALGRQINRAKKGIGEG